MLYAGGRNGFHFKHENNFKLSDYKQLVNSVLLAFLYHPPGNQNKRISSQFVDGFVIQRVYIAPKVKVSPWGWADYSSAKRGVARPAKFWGEFMLQKEREKGIKQLPGEGKRGRFKINC
jgi:hypothetical protein